jgi:hypothetical protein
MYRKMCIGYIQIYYFIKEGGLYHTMVESCPGAPVALHISLPIKGREWRHIPQKVVQTIVEHCQDHEVSVSPVYFRFKAILSHFNYWNEISSCLCYTEKRPPPALSYVMTEAKMMYSSHSFLPIAVR